MGAWPTAVGFGHQSTVYGARPYAYGRGVAAHPGVATSFTARSPQGLHGVVGHYYGKRSADAEADAFYGYGNALVGPSGVSAAWPTAVGFGHQSTVYGARPYVYGKRSADADAEADPYYGYGYGRAYGYGLGYHGYHHGGYYGHGYGHGYGYGYYG